jgi:hypothetical protein
LSHGRTCSKKYDYNHKSIINAPIFFLDGRAIITQTFFSVSQNILPTTMSKLLIDKVRSRIGNKYKEPREKCEKCEKCSLQM